MWLCYKSFITGPLWDLRADIRQNLLKKKKKSAHVVFKNNSSTGGEAPSAFIPQM